MSCLTTRGERFVEELAQRHGFSNEAVTHMLMAVRDGNAGMAQFTHSEFGGYGQWMRGGMLMLGDMFNHTLKARVDALCVEIADWLAAEPGLIPARHWWPAELGTPNAAGAQNHLRYAYFADAGRLAIEVGGIVWVYDTDEHRIDGFSSRQQGDSGSIALTSQYGSVDLSRLRVVSRNGQPVPIEPAPAVQAEPAGEGEPSGRAASCANEEIFAALERLGDLKAKGIVSDEELAAKKAELLARL